MTSIRLAGGLLATLALLSALPLQAAAPGRADDASVAAPATSPAEQAWKTASVALQHGPQAIALRDQARLDLPENYGFVPPKEGRTLMEALGNDVDDGFLGLIFPLGEESWMVELDYDAAGYIKDDDARNWKSDELLQNLKDGTKAGNARREKLGLSPLEVTRWIEAPSYEPLTQRLVWSAEAREIGAPQDADATVNYNTYLLGREGYVSMNLITSATQVEAQKPTAKRLLSALRFNEGKRYADFDSSKDQVAAYGLAALVGGLAAKKLGLLALAGVFFAKFAKLLVLAAAGAAALFGRLFRRRQT
ncbi:MAG: hypothetical protein NVS9B10_12830 [Nevskia sp.]